MKLNRLRVCQQVSNRLSILKGRTGLTPNILCRIGFCLSLNDPAIPNPDDYPPDSEREVNRHTLTGPWDQLFVALIKERCQQDGLPLDDAMLAAQFRAHINRGVLLLYKRVRSINDLVLLMPRDILQNAQRVDSLESDDAI
ncbi:MAG: DNA sulfur modification protein DndE [Chloroflexi bacterium]|nr:MAG: DNA sulfur modification protein DndE [Chloroflexota bacterium]RLC86284.1 MAG: DNA sulfur modification protein DndE [Chloroflexota bacterium]